MLTEAGRSQNYSLFKKKLEQIGVDTEKLFTKYGEMIENAPFAPNESSRMAYDGAMIQHVMRVVTPYAIKINDLIPESLKPETNSLIKVCLLHQVAKAVMFVPNDNDWEVNNRGINYKYATYNVALRTGFRSLLLCQECGINFTAEEAEAMTIMDRDATDEQAKFYCTPLSVILRQANELALMDVTKSTENK